MLQQFTEVIEHRPLQRRRENAVSISLRLAKKQLCLTSGTRYWYVARAQNRDCVFKR